MYVTQKKSRHQMVYRVSCSAKSLYSKVSLHTLNPHKNKLYKWYTDLVALIVAGQVGQDASSAGDNVNVCGGEDLDQAR